MGIAVFHVVYRTGYHVMSEEKVLQAQIEIGGKEMGDIVNNGQLVG
jgi:RNA-binding protein YlmH